MSFWVITSWVFVAILTGVNIFIFLKFKQVGDQMQQAMGGRDMGQMMAQMQQMMGAMQGRGGAAGGRDAQLKAAMEMLSRSQKGGGPRR